MVMSKPTQRCRVSWKYHEDSLKWVNLTHTYVGDIDSLMTQSSDKNSDLVRVSKTRLYMWMSWQPVIWFEFLFFHNTHRNRKFLYTTQSPIKCILIRIILKLSVLITNKTPYLNQLWLKNLQKFFWYDLSHSTISWAVNQIIQTSDNPSFILVTACQSVACSVMSVTICSDKLYSTRADIARL